MKKKVIKNEDAPLGRRDWIDRSHRWRPSWQLWKFAIMKECMEDYFFRHPETRTTKEYSDLYDEICRIHQEMQTPLTATIEEYPLF